MIVVTLAATRNEKSGGDPKAAPAEASIDYHVHPWGNVVMLKSDRHLYQVLLAGQSPRLVVLAAVHLCVNSPVAVLSTENVSPVAMAFAVTT